MKKSRRHALGQHFLHDAGTLSKIVRVIAAGPEDLVVEVGPGRGALTALLAGRAGRLVAVEKDIRLIPILQERPLPGVTIIHGDILEVDWKTLVQGQERFPGGVTLAGNIPYSISSPLLFKLHDERALIRRAVVLLQKEFAARVCARPGSKKFAPLSILLQNAFTVAQHFTIPPQAFVPPPRVKSALLSLTRRPAPLYPSAADPAFLSYLRAVFGHRRKTLLNNLKRPALPEASVRDLLRRLGLNPKARAEELSLAEHAALFESLRKSVSIPAIFP